MIKCGPIGVGVLSMLLVTACSHAVNSEVREIQPNETAFLIALDGNTVAGQAKLNSVEFLEKNKVADKRIVIPHKMINICPECWLGNYQEVASAKLITIDRSPVTREWTAPATTGTSTANQGFSVESSESIDFTIGGTFTAHIAEDDAAKFLYFYAGKQLAEIADGNIRSFLSSSISKQFGTHTLDWGRQNKAAVFDQAKTEAQQFFSARGITIDNFGFTEGMTYHDPQIQDAINKKFVADTQVQTAHQMVEAAQVQAQAAAAVQGQQDLLMRQRALDLQQKAIDKWDGHMPQTMLSSAMPFGLPMGGKVAP